MLMSIKLQHQLSCEYICEHIQKMLVRYQKENDVSDCVLVFDIQKVTDDTSLIPKIEYKNIET